MAAEVRPADAPDLPERRQALHTALGLVRERIAGACAAAGREADDVTLIAVTKTYPATDVALLAGLGVTDVGENRDQEAAAKAAAVSAVAPAPLRWHYVGRLQRNKCRSVVRYADVVQSVDSQRLAVALGEAARQHRDRPLDVLIQVSIDGDPARGGALAGGMSAGEMSAGEMSAGGVGADADRDLWRIADTVAAADGLRLAGLMGVAPLGWDPDRAFAALALASARLGVDHPTATVMSAGMSGDLEAAIRHGATHVRIGSALLGMRNTLR